MLRTIEFNDPQYPPASQGDAVQSGLGPNIALLIASIYSKLIDRPANLNFNLFKTALHIFLLKLEKVATYGIKVPTSMGSNNPMDAFLAAGDAFLKVVKLKCFKGSIPPSQAIIDRASVIPIRLAQMVYHNNGFIFPTKIARNSFSVGALNFRTPPTSINPRAGPLYLTSQLGNFYATLTVRQGGATDFGIVSGCFKFSPLSPNGTASITQATNFLQLIIICDFAVVGLTPSNFFDLTITGSWTGLPKIGKGFAYKVVQIDQRGIANPNLLQNIIPTVTGVTFDLPGPNARIAIVKEKADKNFAPVGWRPLNQRVKPPKSKPKQQNTPKNSPPSLR